MKSLLDVIGVEEFERAMRRAVRRAARETLAAGGSYLGIVDGKLVRVGPRTKSSKRLKITTVRNKV